MEGEFKIWEAGGMYTSLVEVGTPPHQLAELDQSEFDAPVQCPVEPQLILRE
jgi:hypothetical protein